MTPSITEANAALRAAVEHRNEAQAAGLPHEEWYGHVAEPLPERQVAADWLHDATRSTITDDEIAQQIHEHHLHRAGVTDNDIEAMSEEELDAAIERLTPKPPETHAVSTLRQAIDAVTDRHGRYGPPTEHFARTASMVNAAFGTSFTPADWALVMVLDKVARQRGPEATDDAAIDIAGYAACHQECRRRA